MENLILFLQNKKSYILGVCVALYALLKAFGVLNTDAGQDTAVYAILAALFGVALKAGINRELGKRR